MRIKKGGLFPYDDSLLRYNTQLRKLESLKDDCEAAVGTRDFAKANKRLDTVLDRFEVASDD